MLLFHNRLLLKILLLLFLPNDYQKFSQLFIKTVGSAQGDLDGSRAKDIFLKAKLPTTTLGQIWSLVDRYNTGKLNVGGFVIAMYLIQGLLSGHIKQLPPFCLNQFEVGRATTTATASSNCSSEHSAISSSVSQFY